MLLLLLLFNLYFRIAAHFLSLSVFLFSVKKIYPKIYLARGINLNAHKTQTICMFISVIAIIETDV